MAFKIFNVLKDSFIDSTQAKNNFGGDSLLELQSEFDTVAGKRVCRFLFNFDVDKVKKQVQEYGNVGCKVFAIFKIAGAPQTTQPTTVSVHPLNSTWVEGLGKKRTVKFNRSGVCWKYRDITTETGWTAEGGDYGNAIGSVDYTVGQIGGDLKLDITQFIENLIAQNKTHLHGFIVKLTDAIETASKEFSYKYSYYSRFQITNDRPFVQVCKDFQSDPILNIPDGVDNIVDFKFLFQKYSSKNGENCRMYFNVSERYPKREITNRSMYTKRLTLPKESFYSVVERSTGKVVVPQSIYTRLGQDKHGCFLDLQGTFLEKAKEYEIKLSYKHGESTILVENLPTIKT